MPEEKIIALEIAQVLEQRFGVPTGKQRAYIDLFTNNEVVDSEILFYAQKRFFGQNKVVDSEIASLVQRFGKNNKVAD